MVGRAAVVPFWITGAFFVLQAPLHAQTAHAESPVSIARIRAALEREPALRLPPAPGETPIFRLEVRPPLFVLKPVEETPFDPTFGLPSAGELLMGGIEKIRSAAVHYKRGRTKRRVRKEVDDALAAFCTLRECPPPVTSK